MMGRPRRLEGIRQLKLRESTNNLDLRISNRAQNFCCTDLKFMSVRISITEIRDKICF